MGHLWPPCRTSGCEGTLDDYLRQPRGRARRGAAGGEQHGPVPGVQHPLPHAPPGGPFAASRGPRGGGAQQQLLPPPPWQHPLAHAGVVRGLHRGLHAVQVAAGGASCRRPRRHPLGVRRVARALVQLQHGARERVRGGGDAEGDGEAAVRRGRGPGVPRARPLLRAQLPLLQPQPGQVRTDIYCDRRRRQPRGHRRALGRAAAGVVRLPRGQLRPRHRRGGE
mmetsp:Transcript_38790/g.84407  ORF Transcript_38790/g.84407 Transcript_38790/m.84407 type:complete len:223 (+) Transcript_38790:853-1521(+)